MTERVLGISMFVLLLALPVHPAFGELTASFRYPLSNFSGPVPSQWAQLAVDQERNEIYALNRRGNDIRIFDAHGMEIHSFGEGFGTAADIAIGDDGDIFILSRGYGTSAVQLLDYRGELISEITPTDVPAAFSEHRADRLVYTQGSLYLVDSDSLSVIVLDADGRFKKGYDLDTILRRSLGDDDRLKKKTEKTDWTDNRLEDVSLNGFHVDRRGNMLFTVPVLFSAFRLSSDGGLAVFGRPGSAPGKFGVVAGIATDDMGYIYVADRLRSVVLVFDHNFVFQTEFGYRGGRPSNLIVPDDVAIDAGGNVYVAQAANRGVSVFRVAHDKAGPPQAGHSPSTDSEAYGRTIEEKTSPDRPESVVDQGGDELSAAAERFDPAVEEKASPERLESSIDQGGDAPSTGPEGHAPIVEEVYLPERLEFILDGGGDTPSTGSEEYDPTVEDKQSNQVENVKDAEN